MTVVGQVDAGRPCRSVATTGNRSCGRQTRAHEECTIEHRTAQTGHCPLPVHMLGEQLTAEATAVHVRQFLVIIQS